MINIRRWLNENYLYSKLDTKDLFYIFIILIIILFFSFSSIIRWGSLVIVIWILSKIYNLKKKYIDQDELDKYCVKGNKDPKCITYNNAKKNYNKTVNNINKVLGL